MLFCSLSMELRVWYQFYDIIDSDMTAGMTTKYKYGNGDHPISHEETMG